MKIPAAGLILFVECARVAQPAASVDCAPCHRAIYERYQRTPMAKSSGPVGGGLIREDFAQASFTHVASGFAYRVARTAGGITLEFAKADGSLAGKRTMTWFVGSGAAARSYLLADDGYLFEAPAAYYSRQR